MLTPVFLSLLLLAGQGTENADQSARKLFPYVVAGGDHVKLKEQGLEQIADLKTLKEFAQNYQFEVVQDGSLYYLLHRSLTEPQRLPDVLMLLNRARVQKLPITVRGSESPDMKKALQRLLQTTSLGFGDTKGYGRPAEDTVVQVSFAMEAKVSSGGKTWTLSSHPVGDAKNDRWPMKDGPRQPLKDDEALKGFSMSVFVSPIINPAAGKDFTLQALTIAKRLEEEKIKPALKLEEDIIRETMAQYGKTDWMKRAEVRPEDLPAEINSKFILAMQSMPEMKGRVQEAEALYRSAKITNIKIGLRFITGVQRGQATSRTMVSLDVILR